MPYRRVIEVTFEAAGAGSFPAVSICGKVGEIMADSRILLECREIYKSFDKNKVLQDINLKIKRGEVHALLGQNGAGKSTLVKIITGVYSMDSGQILVDGQPVKMNSPKDSERAGISIIHQDQQLVPFFDVTRNAFLGSEMTGKCGKLDFKKMRSLVQEKLKLIDSDFTADRQISTLSVGQREQAAIVTALLQNPKLLILDEATSGLDPVMRDDILDVFLEFVQDEDHSILMSSHITTDLEKVADYITFIHQGKLLFCKTKDELRYHYGIIRCKAATFNQIDKTEVLAYRKDDYQWNVLVADKEKARRNYKNAIVDDATIDDILLLYVKGEKLK